MFGVSNSIVRANAESRNRLLDYYGHIIKLNEKRAQMQVDIQTVSSDGFMHNIAAVLLMFCDPFLDIRASKIDKIDPSYFRTSKRLDVSEDTKINATKEQSDAYYGQVQEMKGKNTATLHNMQMDLLLSCSSQFHYRDILHDTCIYALWPHPRLGQL